MKVPGVSAFICILGALLCSDAVLATIHIVTGPNENSTLVGSPVCDETWVAWTNDSEPYYMLWPTVDNYTIDDIFCEYLFENNTFYLQVLSGSMPVIPVQYFEEGENCGTGRPVICRTPPGPPTIINPDEEGDYTAMVAVIYVTSSLSIIASIVALFTFFLLPRLRTLSGWVIINLFISFLLGEIMLQIRIGFEINSQYFLVNATLGQGLLMSRFIWMSIAGFEMCRSLYRGIKMKLNSRQQMKFFLAGYMIVGWGGSIMMMIIMGVAEGEGGEKVRKYLGIVGYITNYGTVGFLQLVNIVAVVFISTVIISAAKRQRRLNEKKVTKGQVNYVRLFIVLLTVLGLVWLLFGIAAALPDEVAQRDEIIIPYIIVTDTQPIFVCLAFVCTPKTFRMVMTKLHVPLPEKKGITRRETVSSLYNSSNGDRRLVKGSTQTSLMSLPEINTTSSSPPLKSIIEEEAEDEKRETKNVSRNGCAREIAKKNGTHVVSNGIKEPRETVIVVDS